jgi:bacterioferritin-associated ferredoxin
MIVCHCMNITDHEIRAAVDWMRASDDETIITPGKIYHALGKRADCGGCMPLFLATMRGCDSFEVPMHLRGLTSRASVTGKVEHEGRRQGHRVSQRGTTV